MDSLEQKVERPWWSFGCIGLMTPTDIRNLGRFNLLMFAWALTWCSALFATGSDTLSAPMRILFVATPIALAIGAMVAYLRFLRHADELLRKLHVEALGCGFAVGFLLATSWRMIEKLGAPPLDPVFIGSAMMFGFAIGQAIGRRRYA